MLLVLLLVCWISAKCFRFCSSLGCLLGVLTPGSGQGGVGYPLLFQLGEGREEQEAGQSYLKDCCVYCGGKSLPLCFCLLVHNSQLMPIKKLLQPVVPQEHVAQKKSIPGLRLLPASKIGAVLVQESK